jgi:lipopolysaccharide transport system ATP-binding protein
MSHPAIRVSGLSKLYKVGARQQGYKTLRESIADACAAPFARLRGRGTGDGGQGGTNPKSKIQDPKSSPRLSGEQFWALKDVSFEVQPGEVVGIIGRNGAGKSTLLKILSRITEPTSGRIELRGRVGSLLEVGTGFHPELTGRENIYMNGSILGMSRREIERKFDEIVDFSGIEDFLDTPVKRYSSGMYVRLAFAVAAHLEPEILIVDEVLAVGDAEFQKKCLGKMQDVARHGRTVLFVSHNLAAVNSFCTRGVVLRNGTIVADGDTESSIQAYLAPAGSSGIAESRPLSTFREHWCKPMIQAVKVNGHSYAEPASICLGEPLSVEMTFDTGDHPSLRNPVMGLVFHHATKGTVAGVNTRMTGFQIPSGRYAVGTVSCELPKLYFLQGRYYVDVWLGDGPANLDVLKEYLIIDIDESDYYGTGHAPFANMGTVFLDAEWDFHSNSKSTLSLNI